MISIEMLPAAHGDSLWIEYGAARQPRRILIDGGPAHSYEAGLRRRFSLLPEEKRIFELMVVTHIDADHIDGALILLQDKDGLTGMKFRFNEFWFNSWDQLSKAQGDTYKPLQGEFLGGLITADPKLRSIWNRSFNKGPVVIPDNGPLPEVKLSGGARITLLGPAMSDLRRLRARWNSAIRDFTPGDVVEALKRLKERRDYRPPANPALFSARQYGADRTPANGSSISFVLEYNGVSILLAGDAHARTLENALGRLAAQRSVPRLRFDAVKLPHHGSMGNVTDAWLRKVDSKRWLISTNGAIFGHPDIETVKLIAQHFKKPTIYCNYRSDTTRRLEESTDWVTIFPEKNKSLGPAGGLLLRLTATPSHGSSPTGRGSRVSKDSVGINKRKRSSVWRGEGGK